MSDVMYDYMETYIRSLIHEKNEKLLKLEEYARNNGVPIVQKETGNFLKFMINMKKPKRILELGTAIGYSSILMAEESKNNVHIDTIERDERMLSMARENVKDFNMEHLIQILSGDCEEILQGMCSNGNESYDMIFIDAGKGHYNDFLPYCLKLLSLDGIIVADNVLFRGMVASDELIIKRKSTIVKRMRSYLEEVSSREDLVTSVLPMGDGIAVTVRR
ncbi:Predicted O-methyltransferase YrrM [Hathewaya proteolytica DSM 3090]|uniref:tRNA 5-hydroxyuridine methyltransferase n=1 Tax=Hathewaya proteolytica DSM 3090 TaxID=1121331 RepID=A0A1M6JCM9_9CLOT|nr:O-methyltransferase [Hathewaya proteolytica]SHJ44428.1 Predicted O-methyltransferase YrrM [Hathewaya proteolytica DSM 3090]